MGHLRSGLLRRLRILPGRRFALGRHATHIRRGQLEASQRCRSTSRHASREAFVASLRQSCIYPHGAHDSHVFPVCKFSSHVLEFDLALRHSLDAQFAHATPSPADDVFILPGAVCSL